MQDQVFAVRQVCEKYLANGKDVFWAIMDLEKAYGTIDLALYSFGPPSCALVVIT